MIPQLKPFAAFMVWLLVILYLSFARLYNFPQSNWVNELYLDKVVHFGMYAILETLFLFGFFQNTKPNDIPKMSLVITILFGVSLGCSIEFLQPILTSYRKFEWLDMLANALGVLGGLYFFNRYLKKRILRLPGNNRTY